MALTQEYIDDIVEEAEKYDLLEHLKEGYYVDAKDTVQNWCQGTIDQYNEDNEEVWLHFDGWSSKYDETLATTSSRLESFRMITIGYTGNKNSTRRDGFKYHFGDLETMK